MINIVYLLNILWATVLFNPNILCIHRNKVIFKVIDIFSRWLLLTNISSPVKSLWITLRKKRQRVDSKYYNNVNSRFWKNKFFSVFKVTIFILLRYSEKQSSVECSTMFTFNTQNIPSSDGSSYLQKWRYLLSCCCFYQSLLH